MNRCSICSVGEKVTVGTAITVLTPATYIHADTATIEVYGGPIRFHVDSRVPTASDGKLRYEGGIIELVNVSEIRQFQAIRDGAATADAILQVTYRK